jgi:hypothetical protein
MAIQRKVAGCRYFPLGVTAVTDGYAKDVLARTRMKLAEGELQRLLANGPAHSFR